MGHKDKKNKKKMNKELAVQEELKPVEMDKKSGSSEKKKRKGEKEKIVAVQISTEDNPPKPADNKKKMKKARKGKVKKANNNHDSDGEDLSNTDGFDKLNYDEAVNDQIQFEIQGESSAEMVASEDDRKSKRAKKKRKNLKSLDGIEKNVETVQGISKKSQKKKMRDMNSSNPKSSLEKKEDANQKDVYLIPSEDEGSPKGMKKWIMEYQQDRPGLKVLQQRIDDFMDEHEAKLEQERKEREALSAEEGWQLVTHHKGRKKTKDADGNTVGAVAQAVVESKRAKKKSTDVGLDFYRFQRKEAQRNEIMTLQSKFEQDKKRVQQIRAARKFKPY